MEIAIRSKFGKMALALGVIAIFVFGLLAVVMLLRDVDSNISPEPLKIETRNGPITFTVELADTQEERAVGLMNRAEMASDHGMLFDFVQNRDVMMWMKNTILPLDMLFIRHDGVIEAIAENTVPFSESIIASPGPIRYVLEINAGVSEARGISPGDRVIHPGIKSN